MKKNKKIPQDKVQAEVITLAIAGLSTREIAKKLGISASTVHRIIRQCNNGGKQPTQSADRKDASIAPPDRKDNAETPITDVTNAINKIIKQIELCTNGETDVAKLATAADKLAAVAERVSALTRLTAEQSENSATTNFTADFTSRHHTDKNN